MKRGPSTRNRSKLDEQTNFMMTKEEKQELLDFCDEKQWSVSQACRYLVRKALATEERGD